MELLYIFEAILQMASFLHTLQLQVKLSQFFIILLNVSKFSYDMMPEGTEFQDFSPKDLMLLLPKLT